MSLKTLEKVESRCGIECNKCSYKESHGCTGCINIEKVFWGECPVKNCCETKGLENCGQCDTFPCQILHDFSYSKDEHGDDGKRIEMCKIWCQK